MIDLGLQSAWQRLFVRELPAYLAQFEFGEEFVRDNFAAVNVFSHQMHIEHWFQDETYSFWSLACDIGGALGLFLGASLLTLIELIYLCWRHGVRGERTRNTYMWIREQSARIEPYSPLARLRRFGKKEGDEEKEGEKTRQRDEDEEDRSGTVDGADGVDDDDCWQDDTPSFQPLQGVHFRRPNSAAADLASDAAEEQQRPLLSAPGPSSSSSPLPFVVLDKIDEEASSGDGPQSKASPKTGRGLGAKLSPVLSSLGRRLDGILHPRKRADELQDDVDDSATDAEEGRAGGETKIPETEESELSPEDEPPPESTKNGEQQVLVQISEDDDDDDDGVPPARREKKEEAEKTARQVNPHSKQSTV